MAGPVPCSKFEWFERAKQAFQAILYHEIHIVALALGIFLVTKDTENYVGLRISNIVGYAYEFETEFIFGVRNLYINFLQKR